MNIVDCKVLNNKEGVKNKDVSLNFKVLFFSNKINLAIILNIKYWCVDREIYDLVLRFSELEILSSLEYQKLIHKNESVYLGNPKKTITLEDANSQYQLFIIDENKITQYIEDTKLLQNLIFARNYDNQVGYLKDRTVFFHQLDEVIKKYLVPISFLDLNAHLKKKTYGFMPFCIVNNLEGE